MPQSKRTRNLGIGILLLLVLVGIAAQWFFNKKVTSLLNSKGVQAYQLRYDELNTNVFLGNIRLRQVAAISPNQHIAVQAESVTLSGLHYWTLLQKENITLSELRITSPSVTYQPKEKDTSSTSQNNTSSRTITIEQLTIEKGSFAMKDTSAQRSASLEDINIAVNDLIYPKKSNNPSLPFDCGSYELTGSDGFYDLSPLETITFERIQLNPTEGKLQQFTLRTKYGKKALSQKLAKEHDHYNLGVKNIVLTNWDVGISKDLPYFHLGTLQLEQPVFDVYRDKLLPDDTSHKKLYNQALRDLPLALQVDSVRISDGTITYEERVKRDIEPESLLFTQLDATVQNLHSWGEGEVTAHINAKLMDNGPFRLDWSFDPRNKANTFLVKGELSQFQSASINPFLKSNLNAEVQGTVQQLYFTISGNELESQGDMKMKYDDFEFTVLKKNGLGVNKILTAVVNIFTKDGHKTDEDGFRHGNFKVERKQDKSFFNYLWLNLQEGLVDTMTGRGTKRD